MPKVVWTNEFYVRIYCGAKEGLSNNAIARQIGVAKITFKKWVKKDPAVRDALELARSPNSRKGSEQLVDYVYKRLPDDLKKAWDRINGWSKEQNSQKRIDAYFANRGKNVRQSLFIHAFVVSNFNASEACRKVGISKATLDLWKSEPQFQQLMDSIAWDKENFVEGALFKLVKKGDTSAVLFASKTVNAKRGYADVKTTNVEVKGQITHGVLDLNTLKLPVKLRAEIMEVIREQQAKEEEKTDQPRLALPIHVEDTDED